VLDRHHRGAAREQRPRGQDQQVEIPEVRHDHVGAQAPRESQERQERAPHSPRAQVVHGHVGRELREELAGRLDQAQVQLEVSARQGLEQERHHALRAAQPQARNEEEDAPPHGTRLISRPGT
jgi:hypothetical protein